jgi:thioesterase domain-containing protein
MPLARYVPEDFRLYGLQARGLDGKSEFPGSLRQMAADYLEQIRTVQADGPYYLLGFSFGGIVAHEIAAQLRAGGEEVAALIILDASPPDKKPESGTPRQKIVAGQEPTKPAHREPADPDTMMARITDQVRTEAGQVLGDISDDEVALLAKTFQKNASLLENHDFRRFDGNALVFTATEGKRITKALQGRGHTLAGDWAPYVSGEISEIRLPCTHLDIIQPDMLGQVWAGISSWLGLE